jgi:cytochrome c
MNRRIVQLFVAVQASLLVGTAWGQDNSALELRGRAILAHNCSRCHALGRTGTSPHPEAPQFRVIGQRYAIETLAETLAEGLSTGHPDMPEFVFEIRDVRAILAYLQSIQEPRTEQRSGRTSR